MALTPFKQFVKDTTNKPKICLTNEGPYLDDRLWNSARESSFKVLNEEFKRGEITHAQYITELALLNRVKWSKSTLKVFFFETPGIQNQVFLFAQEYERYCGVRFRVETDPNVADIRVSFMGPRQWSSLGSLSAKVDKRLPTMNLGCFNAHSGSDYIRRVVLHEFGHALGFIHEHQSPASQIKWDKERVYLELGGPPNNWDRAMVEKNLFDRYSETITNSEFDSKSIMIYPIDPSWTTDGFSTSFNMELSDADKRMLKAMYP